MADKSIILKEAQKYIAKGQIDKAIVEWEKLAKESPDGNTYNTIGDLYLKKGDKKSAIEFFHKAAGFFREGGFSLKALALHKKVINIDPSDANAFIALGELSEEKGLTTDAIKYYLTAADILSKEPNKKSFLGVYERILSLSPSNIPLRDKVAGLFLKEGLTSQAIREYLYIAKLFLEKGDLGHARDYFIKTLEVQPENDDALIGMSSVYEKKGDMQQAIDYTKKATALHPDDLHLLLRCASLHKELGAYDDAISYTSKVLEIAPSDFAANRLMGEIHLIRGDREKAWEAYKAVVDSLALENKIDDAIDLVKQFKDIDPVELGKLLISLYRRKDDPDGVFEEMLFVADILSDSGLQDEAIGYYREALKMHPDDAGIKKILAEQEMGIGIEPPSEEKARSIEDLLTDADIFIKYGLYDEAQPILEELKLREPNNVEVHSKLKSLYRDTNDKEQTVTECLILSELHRRNGDVAMQEAALQEAFEINPDDPRVLERLAPGEEEAPALPESEETVSTSINDYVDEIAEAEFYMRQGLKDDALRVYHRLSKIFPENEDFLNKISSLEGGLPGEAVSGEGISSDEGKGKHKESFPPTEPEIIEADELQGIGEQQFDSDVLDIFEEFKKGLEQELEAEDYETHYNLGIAYKEMGLIDDAIKAFQTAKKDPNFAVRSTTMLGICYMEKGLSPLAIEAFREALENITTRDESYWGAQYDLALAYEKNNNIKEAFDIFSEIYGWNSKFREVAEKLNHIKSILPKEEPTVQKKAKKDRVSYI